MQPLVLPSLWRESRKKGERADSAEISTIIEERGREKRESRQEWPEVAISREKPSSRFFSRAKISFSRKAQETVFLALFDPPFFFIFYVLNLENKNNFKTFFHDFGFLSDL